MFSKIKNIIIVLIIVGVLVFSYFFFFKDKSISSSLTSTLVSNLLVDNNGENNKVVDTEFLTILLGIKDIKLNDSIFSDLAFTNLRDSSITLIQDENNKGRRNPFAPIGNEGVAVEIPAEETSN